MESHFPRTFALVFSAVTSLGFCGAVAAQTSQAPAVDSCSGVSISATPAVKEADAWYENYRFRDGEVLPKLRIHYATLGQPHQNSEGHVTNAVLVLHWTGSSGASLLNAAYMNSLFGPGCPLDASRYYLILPDSVGHGQSSKPSDGLRTRFPKYGYNDIVDLQHKLVTETLGIDHLHAILGMSMGGMNAWQWAEAYPDAVDGIMPVVSLPIRVSGRNLLWRRIVIGAIRNDPEWENGNYSRPPSGWVSSFPMFRMMLDGVPHLQATIANSSSADQYIENAKKQALSIDANDILYSLQSSSDYDPEPRLASIRAKVFVLNFADDAFNPAELHVLDRLMPLVPHGQYVVQNTSSRSIGHFTMSDPTQWSSQVSKFMHQLDD
jgi:homoserine O-acetyltransferase